MKNKIISFLIILLLIASINLNIYAKVVPSITNTETEIAQYCSENNNDLSGVSKEILEQWYITIVAGPNGGRSAPFKAVVAQAAENAGVDTETIFDNKSSYVEAYKDKYNFTDIDETNIDFWKPTSTGGNTEIKTLAGKILGAIQVVGSVVSVIALVIIGIKYMLASVEEKAKYKETLMPYLIGCILVFATSNIASILYKIGINLG